jgi:hypothetical protein
MSAAHAPAFVQAGRQPFERAGVTTFELHPFFCYVCNVHLLLSRPPILRIEMFQTFYVRVALAPRKIALGPEISIRQ